MPSTCRSRRGWWPGSRQCRVSAGQRSRDSWNLAGAREDSRSARLSPGFWREAASLAETGWCGPEDADASVVPEDDMAGVLLRFGCWCANLHPHRQHHARTSTHPACHTTNPQVTASPPRLRRGPGRASRRQIRRQRPNRGPGGQSTRATKGDQGSATPGPPGPPDNLRIRAERQPISIGRAHVHLVVPRPGPLSRNVSARGRSVSTSLTDSLIASGTSDDNGGRG